jgi:hypothetical protein
MHSEIASSDVLTESIQAKPIRRRSPCVSPPMMVRLDTILVLVLVLVVQECLLLVRRCGGDPISKQQSSKPS